MIQPEKGFFYTFFLPAFLILAFFSLYALFGVLNLSFDQVDLKYPEVRGYTFQNYISLLSDYRFGNAIKVSFIWSITTTIGAILFGLMIALFIFRRFSRRTEAIIAVLFIIPAFLSRVGVAQIWRLMYRPFGLLNFFVALMGLDPVNFLADPTLAFISVIIVDIWQWCFLVAFLFLSLLNGIPEEYIEETMVEGANWWQTHWYVSLPMILPGFLSIFFIKLVESLRAFDLIYNMTQGGPGNATETLDLYAFYQGITIAGKISYAAAMSVIMLILTLIMLMMLWKRLWMRSVEQ